MTTVALLTEPVPADDEAGLGCLTTERGNLPLTDVAVAATITGLLHITTVRQTFTNPHDEPLEATYIFPLPDRAAVSSFRLTTGDRVIEGELRERGEARQAYDDAIAAGRVAAIAEQERPNVFTVRVGNVLPREVAAVELGLTGSVALDASEATWRFPLVVAPRYIPGAPLAGDPVGDGTAEDTDAVPDASRITPPILLPGFPNPVRLSVRVELAGAGLPVTNLRCSLPADLDGGVLTLRPGQRLDRDLLVRFDVTGPAVTTSLVAHDGTFALTVVPPAGNHQRPRDVVFVLDRSGSMEGWKMAAARRAVARMIDTLGPADRYALLAFDNVVEQPPDLQGLVAATDRHRFRGVEWLANLTARGGTELLEPLRNAVSLLAADPAGGEGPHRDRVLVLATDGQVGNEDQILAALSGSIGGTRIFTVGIDTAVNDAFLRRLAAIGGGSCELVESEDRLDEVMDRIHRRIGTPVLTGVSVAGDGLDIEPGSIAPQRFGALHPGAPLIVYGRYQGAATGGIRISATDAQDRPWSATVPVTGGGSDALYAAWARTRIRDLEDRYVSTADPDIERRIVEISLAANVLCRFTAFVAVGVTVVNEGGKLRRVTQPVDAPSGWQMFDAPTSMFSGGSSPVGYAASMPASMPAPAARRPRFTAVRAAGQPALARAEEKQALARPSMESPRTVAGEPELDLTPYRQRAKQMTDRVGAGELDTVALRRELTDLIDDLRSVGVAEPVLAPLVALLAQLRGDGWTGEVTALRDFAEGSPATPQRPPFWKR
jgi:Ca-activated chloride channel family protein